MKNNKKRRGFTLVELLVVIAIIAILTAIVVTNLTTAKAKSRDAKRVSDLSQLQLAMEIFFDRCNRYPAISSNMPNKDDSCTSGSSTVYLRDFISQIPNPPTAGDYTYAINTTPATDYVLRAKLEGSNSVLNDDTDGTVYTLDCSDASPNYYYCVVPK